MLQNYLYSQKLGSNQMCNSSEMDNNSFDRNSQTFKMMKKKTMVQQKNTNISLTKTHALERVQRKGVLLDGRPTSD